MSYSDSLARIWTDRRKRCQVIRLTDVTNVTQWDYASQSPSRMHQKKQNCYKHGNGRMLTQVESRAQQERGYDKSFSSLVRITSVPLCPAGAQRIPVQPEPNRHAFESEQPKAR